MSRVSTAGFKARILSRATNGSGAAPTTSRSASAASVSDSIFRTMAESSTIKTRILRISGTGTIQKGQRHGEHTVAQIEGTEARARRRNKVAGRQNLRFREMQRAFFQRTQGVAADHVGQLTDYFPDLVLRRIIAGLDAKKISC